MLRLCFCLFFVGLFTSVASAATIADNPFFGKTQNQIALYGAAGVNSGFLIPPPSQFVPFYFLHLQYSIPTTFFRVPARQSLNLGQTIGTGHKYGWDWDRYSIPMIFLTWDIPLIYGDRWYTSAGAGGGLQAHENERLGAKLVFQFKLAAGAHINNRTSIEIYTQHFSNANTADENYSYGFYGMGVLYNF